jgi:hypothetical protein
MDLRKQKRVRIDLPVKLSVLDESGAVAEQREGKLQDLSKGGCAVIYFRELPVGTRTQVEIRLDDARAEKFGKRQLSVKGAVCRIQKKQKEFLLSIRFFRESELDQKRFKISDH